MKSAVFAVVVSATACITIYAGWTYIPVLFAWLWATFGLQLLWLIPFTVIAAIVYFYSWLLHNLS
jgi:hypothetical protein